MPPAEIRSDLLTLVETCRAQVSSAQKRYEARRSVISTGTVIAPADAESMALAEEYASLTHALQHAISALAATGYFEAAK